MARATRGVGVPLLLSRKEAAFLLGMTVTSFNRLVRFRAIPPPAFPPETEPDPGRMTRLWRRKDLEKWVDDGCPLPDGTGLLEVDNEAWSDFTGEGDPDGPRIDG